MFIKYFKIISSFFLKLFGEKRFVYSVNVFPASIKSIKSIQKYKHIIESYARILKIFILMFLLCKADDEGRLINALISLGISYRLKESNFLKHCYYYFAHIKQPNEFQYQNTHQDLLYMPHPLFQWNCVQVDYF